MPEPSGPSPAARALSSGGVNLRDRCDHIVPVDVYLPATFEALIHAILVLREQIGETPRRSPPRDRAAAPSRAALEHPTHQMKWTRMSDLSTPEENVRLSPRPRPGKRDSPPRAHAHREGLGAGTAPSTSGFAGL